MSNLMKHKRLTKTSEYERDNYKMSHYEGVIRVKKEQKQILRFGEMREVNHV